jgi:hypothetical protein
VRTPDRGATVLEISRELLALLQALPGGPEPFAPDALLGHWGDHAEAGHRLVDALVGAGLLGWVDAPPG